MHTLFARGRPREFPILGLPLKQVLESEARWSTGEEGGGGGGSGGQNIEIQMQEQAKFTRAESGAARVGDDRGAC